MIEFSGVATFEEFEKISVDRLFDVWNKAKSEVMGMPSTPVIDGNLITDSASNISKRNEQHQIPYMVGSNSEDIVPIFIHKMAKTWCDKQKIPSYCYMFNLEPLMSKDTRFLLQRTTNEILSTSVTSGSSYPR